MSQQRTLHPLEGIVAICALCTAGSFMLYTRGRSTPLWLVILFALIMLYNVLYVIWPNQQVVIGNARNV